MRDKLATLIDRMTVAEPGVSSVDSVSWHAHREAELVADLSLLSELGSYLDSKPRPRNRAAAYFVIGAVGKNLRSPECARMLIDRASREKDKYALAILLDRLAELPKPDELELKPVFALLQDSRWLVRHAAIGSLKHSLSPEVEDHLLEVLRTTNDVNDVICCHAALNRIGTLKSLPALQSNLGSTKRDVKLSAQAAIAAIEARRNAHQLQTQ